MTEPHITINGTPTGPGHAIDQREHLVALANEAGARYELIGPGAETTAAGLVFREERDDNFPALYRFAALVAEDCAKRCDAEASEAGFHDSYGFASGAEQCARLIRAKYAPK